MMMKLEKKNKNLDFPTPLSPVIRIFNVVSMGFSISKQKNSGQTILILEKLSGLTGYCVAGSFVDVWNVKVLKYIEEISSEASEFCLVCCDLRNVSWTSALTSLQRLLIHKITGEKFIFRV